MPAMIGEGAGDGRGETAGDRRRRFLIVGELGVSDLVVVLVWDLVGVVLLLSEWPFAEWSDFLLVKTLKLPALPLLLPLV